MKRVSETISDLGHEKPPESPIAKLGQAQLSPAELEPEDSFDARDYLNSGLNLGHYLEPMGFSKRDDVEDGVSVYTLRHAPLMKPLRFYADDDTVDDITWANIHVRFDPTATIPFWRVLVCPGYDEVYLPCLQMAKIVRLDAKAASSMEWVPDAAEAAKLAVESVRQSCHGHLAVLTHRFKQAGYRPFKW